MEYGQLDNRSSGLQTEIHAEFSVKGENSGCGFALSSHSPGGKNQKRVQTAVVTCVFVLNLMSALLTVAMSAPPMMTSLPHRLAEMCSDTFGGQDGDYIEGFELQKVFVAMTPGLILPSSTYEDFTNPPRHLQTVMSFEDLAKQHTSLKVKTYPEAVHLKNDRKPGSVRSSFKSFKMIPDFVENRPKALSFHGLAQSILLGEFLSKRYGGKLNSIHSQVLPKHVAETTGDEVLYQSIAAAMHGMLSKEQFNRINIGKSPVNFCKTCNLKDPSCNCNDYLELHPYIHHAYHFETRVFKDVPFQRDIQPSLEDSQYTPVKEIISQIASKVCSNSKENRIERLFISTNLDSHFDKSDSLNLYLSSSKLFKKYAMARTLPLIYNIKSWLDANFNSDSDDFKIVSIDDLMMSSVLASLGIISDKHSKPASRLVIESYKQVRSELVTDSKDQNTISIDKYSNYFIRLVYNGDVITSLVPRCQNMNLIKQGLCPSDLFFSTHFENVLN